MIFTQKFIRIVNFLHRMGQCVQNKMQRKSCYECYTEESRLYMLRSLWFPRPPQVDCSWRGLPAAKQQTFVLVL